MKKIPYKNLITFVVMLIIPSSGFSIDIYVPSLPAVSHYFDVPKSLVQLSITTFMIGIGIMQLFAGSISDSFGRKKPFVISMFIYIVVTFLAANSQSIYELLVSRFIQGCAAGCFIVPMRSVIADLYEGLEFQKIITYVAMTWGLGTVVAPGIGGYLQQHFGWRSNFYFLGVYSSIVFLLLLIYMPETSEYKHPFKLIPILKRYHTILLNKRYFLGLLFLGVLYALLILFGIVGPFLIQNQLHYSPVQFGYVALFMGLAWFLGNTTSRFILHIPIKKKTTFCLWFMLVISIISLGLALVLPLNLYSIVIPSFILFWAGGVLYPSYISRALGFFPEMSGSANAMMGSLVFLTAGLASSIGTLLKSTSEIPLMTTYLVIVIICLAIYYYDARLAKIIHDQLENHQGT